MVMHNTYNDSIEVMNSYHYCPRRVIFFNDTLTARTLYIGDTKTTSNDCGFFLGRYFVKNICPSINFANLDSNLLQTLYDSLQSQLINTNGDNFTID